MNNSNKLFELALQLEPPWYIKDVKFAPTTGKISGCFRTKKGADMFYIIRSYISTAIKQNRNIMNLLKCAFEDETVALV